MPKRNLAWVLVVAMIALLMWQLPQIIAGRDSVYKAFGPLVDVRAQIHRRFVDDVPDQELVDAAVRAGISAMVDVLNDPHAVYLDDRAYSRLQDTTHGVVGGIGVELWSTPMGMEVLSRHPNSPAARAGIKPLETITSIDGHSTKGMSVVEAIGLLNGETGTEVRVRVMPYLASETATNHVPDTPRKLTLRREEIELDPIRGWARLPDNQWRFMIDADARIAYVRLMKFTDHVADQLDAVVGQLEKQDLRGLILDLRENPGGLLSSAREVANRFLDGGLLIVRTSGRKADEKQWYSSRDGTYPPIEVVVLINESTASAATGAWPRPIR